MITTEELEKVLDSISSVGIRILNRAKILELFPYERANIHAAFCSFIKTAQTHGVILEIDREVFDFLKFRDNLKELGFGSEQVVQIAIGMTPKPNP